MGTFAAVMIRFVSVKPTLKRAYLTKVLSVIGHHETVKF